MEQKLFHRFSLIFLEQFAGPTAKRRCRPRATIFQSFQSCRSVVSQLSSLSWGNLIHQVTLGGPRSPKISPLVGASKSIMRLLDLQMGLRDGVGAYFWWSSSAVDVFTYIFSEFDAFFVYSPNKGGTTGGGFLLVLYRITFVGQDFPSPSTCLDLPILA